MASLVLFPFLEPVWLSLRALLIIGAILSLITFSSTLHVYDIRLIVRYSLHFIAFGVLGMGMKKLVRKSSGISPDV